VALATRAFFIALVSIIGARSGRSDMEKTDLELIRQHMSDNQVLANLYNEHLDFEKKLEVYDSKSHLTPGEEVEKKTLQKLKLQGRDKMEHILGDYR
jgi:uncharacterized protein